MVEQILLALACFVAVSATVWFVLRNTYRSYDNERIHVSPLGFVGLLILSAIPLVNVAFILIFALWVAISINDGKYFFQWKISKIGGWIDRQCKRLTKNINK
jgi:hypothetical protein